MDFKATLEAFADLQLRMVGGDLATPFDDAREVAGEIEKLLARVPELIRVAFGVGLEKVQLQAHLRHWSSFENLSLEGRREVVEELEDDDLAFQLVLIPASLTRLVIYSRDPARNAIRWSRPEGERFDLPEPAPPDLNTTFDVCVIGSGAGGSVVAARAAEAGKSVLILEAGPWVNPAKLSSRDHESLMNLYKGAGAQPGTPPLDRLLRPSGLGLVNVLQARAVGGGPLVNNAIHLDLPQETLARWRAEEDFPLEWAPISEMLGRVHEDLGVSTSETVSGSGVRSRAFKEAALALQLAARELPLSVRGCIGCGGCNVGCAFGHKTAGLRKAPPAGGKLSYLERARAKGAQIACNTEAQTAEHGLGSRVESIRARQMRPGLGPTDAEPLKIRARQFVVAAGSIASSQFLQRSLVRFPIFNRIGSGISSNVASPVMAFLPQNVASMDPLPGGLRPPDPGLQMCYYVGRNGRLLETYFHYPGSLAVGVPKRLREHARIMKQYGRMAICGVVVPTKPHGSVEGEVALKVSVDDMEFAQLTKGIEEIARVWMEAGAEEVVPGTRHDVTLRRATFDADLARLNDALRGPGDLVMSTAHPQGGNAMRRSSGKGIVGPDFRVFGMDNLFVADASVFPSGSDVNPQKTVMALAHLAADRVVAAT